MPRKPLIYIPDFPYHIVARSNNKEWFRGDMHDIWNIFCEEIFKLNQNYSFAPHVFVLMSNHYHLIASCHENYNLGYIMRLLQSRTAIRINKLSGRINHCYGGRYKASIIGEPCYYANALKYLYRNPVHAGLVNDVKDWRFLAGSIIQGPACVDLPISSHMFEKSLVKHEDNILKWLNKSFHPDDYKKLQVAAKKTIFKFARTNSYKLTNL